MVVFNDLIGLGFTSKFFSLDQKTIYHPFHPCKDQQFSGEYNIYEVYMAYFPEEISRLVNGANGTNFIRLEELMNDPKSDILRKSWAEIGILDSNVQMALDFGGGNANQYIPSFVRYLEIMEQKNLPDNESAKALVLHCKLKRAQLMLLRHPRLDKDCTKENAYKLLKQLIEIPNAPEEIKLYAIYFIADINLTGGLNININRSQAMRMFTALHDNPRTPAKLLTLIKQKIGHYMVEFLDLQNMMRLAPASIIENYPALHHLKANGHPPAIPAARPPVPPVFQGSPVPSLAATLAKQPARPAIVVTSPTPPNPKLAVPAPLPPMPSSALELAGKRPNSEFEKTSTPISRKKGKQEKKDSPPVQPPVAKPPAAAPTPIVIDDVSSTKVTPNVVPPAAAGVAAKGPTSNPSATPTDEDMLKLAASALAELEPKEEEAKAPAPAKR